ncbi:MAG: glycosyltransferase [Acidimicrobiales bacterium]
MGADGRRPPPFSRAPGEALSASRDGAPAGPGPSILLLVTRMNIGGPAQQVLLLAKGLSPELSVTVAAGSPAGREGELADPGVPVQRAPLVRPVRPATDLRALASITRLVRGGGFRLVHTHMAKAGTIGRVAALLGTRREGRPKLVHTFHGHVLEGYFAGPEQRAFLQLERMLARRTDALVAVSPEVRDSLLDLGVGRPSQWRVIPLGLDLHGCLAVGPRDGSVGKLRSALGLPGDVPLIGVLGRLVPVKDHASLFTALATIPEAHLAVLGDGELRAPLEALARDLGIAGRTHFTGWWADVPGALGDVDVVALPSRNEGTPVALIEALAACRAVVATDVGGVRHVVQDGETGWLCPPGDAGALASRLQRVLSDPAGQARLAYEGRRRVAERFGQARMVGEHLELYRELLGA